MTKILRIGTRGSKLALTQTGMVAEALRAAVPGLVIEVVEIKTSGDWKPEQGETRLAEAAGGKGQFAKEIEDALLADRIDCGVHSLKDMPAFLPKGLVIDHVLEREDPRDVLLSNIGETLEDLPQGAVVGTASLRRQSFILAKRPDLKIVPLRGNVPTRIEKLRAGQVDAAILAMAGLKRLGLEKEISSVLDILPAAGQGIIGIETREDDAETRALLDLIHCTVTGYSATAERAALAVLDGSCRTPVGAYAVIDGETMTLEVTVGSADGLQIFTELVRGKATDAAALGRQAGATLKAIVPEGILT